MKRRLKLLKALETDKLTVEEKEHISQFPHIYFKPVSKVAKKKGRKK